MPVLTIQRRMMELGRVRLGEKGPKGEPRKLSSFRFTSASKVLLDALAEKHGGTVREWKGAPEEGYWEVTTRASELEIILPPVYSDVDGRPTVPYSQFFELWSGGGCQRRCDGITEAISGKPCLCTGEERACKITTRVSFMLPDIPGLGVWRLESHGMNAAVELPTTLEVLVAAAKEHRFIPAVLTIQHRTKKVPGEGTRRFIVPAITLPGVTVQQLADGTAPLALNAPAPAPPRPELPAGPPPPEDPAFADAETAEWGAAPTLAGPEGRGAQADTGTPQADQRTSASGSARVDETTELTGRLLAAADRIGGETRDVADAAIARNRTANMDTPAKHLTWLKGQVTRMEKQAPEQG